MCAYESVEIVLLYYKLLTKNMRILEYEYKCYLFNLINHFVMYLDYFIFFKYVIKKDIQKSKSKIKLLYVLLLHNL